MKTSRVQEVIEILKASVDEPSANGKRVSKAAPNKSKKVLLKAKKVQKG
jgi:hypothetical protein